MRFLKALFLFVSLSILLIAFGCYGKAQIVSQTWNPQEIERIGAIVDEAGKLRPPMNSYDNKIETRREKIGQTKYMYEKHETNYETMSVLELGLSDTILWPGALLHGDGISKFVYKPIMVDRQPITISVSWETVKGAGNLYLPVSNPSKSTLTQGISKLLEGAIPGGAKVPANFDYSYKQVYNEKHMSAFLNANVSYGIYDLSTKFNWDSTVKKNKIIAKFRQIYFTVNVDTPAHPSNFFSPSMGVDGVKAVLPIGSVPVYVGSVSYGVMALMFIETDFSEQEINASIQAGMNGAWDVEITGKYTSRDILSSSTINIVVYGGDTAGLEDEELGLKGFQKIIENSYSCSPNNWGKPLSYSFYRLSDNTLAGFNLTSEYTIVRTSAASPQVRVTVERMVMDKADDDTAWRGCCKAGRCDGIIGETKVEIDYYWAKATAYNQSDQPQESQNKIGSEKTIVTYGDSGWGVSMDTGSKRPIDKYVDWTFDNWNYDFDLAKIEINVYVTDYDGAGCNRDKATATKTLYGREFFENNGAHRVDFQASDFEGHFDIKIECLNCT